MIVRTAMELWATKMPIYLCHYSLIEKAFDVVGPSPIKSISCSLIGKASDVIGLSPVSGYKPTRFLSGISGKSDERE